MTPLQLIKAGLLALLLLAGAGQTAEMPVAEVDVATISEGMQLGPLMRVMADPTRQLSASQALHAPGWRVPGQQSFTAGVTADAWWVHVRLHNSSSETQRLWLAAGSTRLEHVHFHVLDEQGVEQDRALAGSAHPLATGQPASPVRWMFEVALEAGATQDVLLRLDSRTEIRATLELWQPDAWRMQERHDMLLFLLAIAILLGAGAQVLGSGLLGRDRLMSNMGGWLISCCLYELAYYGYLQHYLLPSGAGWAALLPLTLGLISVIWLYVFFYFALQLHNSLFWKRVVQLMSLFYGIMLLYAWLGDLSQAIVLSHASAFVALLLQPVLLAVRWKHRQARSGAFLMAAMVFFVMMADRVFSILTVLPSSIIMTNVWLAGLLLALFMLALIMGFTQRMFTAYGEKIRLQRELIDYQRQEQERLQDAVDQRSRELQESLIEVREAYRAKSDFLARISHDLRSPLTSILGYAQMIGEQESETAARKAGIITKSARRLLALLNDLIEYAAGERMPQELNEQPAYALVFFNSIADETRLLARSSNNSFSFEVAPGLPPVLLMDSKRIHQIMHNLLSNACKFTEDGRVYFRVQYHADEPDRGTLVLTVTDTGRGIKPELMPVLFEPFRQLESRVGVSGIGLGLAIVKQWLDRMQGKIWIDSQQGVGTHVRVEIPLSSVEEKALTADNLDFYKQVPAEIPAHNYSVWVIEDTEPILELLQWTLESLGFVVRTFDCGAKAMEALNDERTLAPDLIVSDYYLPFYNGRELATASRKRWPRLPLILLSAGFSDELLEESGLFDEILLKSVEWGELSEALERTSRRLLEQSGSPMGKSQVQEGGLPGLQLTEQELQEYAMMLENNAVSEIMHWAVGLKSANPARSELFGRIAQLARSADLAALKALLI